MIGYFSYLKYFNGINGIIMYGTLYWYFSIPTTNLENFGSIFNDIKITMVFRNIIWWNK